VLAPPRPLDAHSAFRLRNRRSVLTCVRQVTMAWEVGDVDEGARPVRRGVTCIPLFLIASEARAEASPSLSFGSASLHENDAVRSSASPASLCRATRVDCELTISTRYAPTLAQELVTLHILDAYSRTVFTK
jgi:hypothetical protein